MDTRTHARTHARAIYKLSINLSQSIIYILMFVKYRKSILRYMHDIYDTSAIYRVYTNNAICPRCLIS